MKTTTGSSIKVKTNILLKSTWLTLLFFAYLFTALYFFLTYADSESAILPVLYRFRLLFWIAALRPIYLFWVKKRTKQL